jgi:hypothetical protein
MHHNALMKAMMRDERKVMLLGKHTPGKPRIHVYSSSGLAITSFTVRSCSAAAVKGANR